MKKPDLYEFMKSDPRRLVELITMFSADQEFEKFFRKVDKKYLPWEKFKYQKLPEGLNVEEAWCYLRYKRSASQESLPVKANNGSPFKLSLTKEQNRMLSRIDSLASGSIALDSELPTGKQKDRLIISGLIEEAINSSQLEGAQTSREVAKEMIRKSRAPKNHDEQMIFNNYVAMTHVEEWKERPLSIEFLNEIHSVIVDKILTRDECGSFRKDEDEIVVSHPTTGKVLHRPMNVSRMALELNELVRFANSDDDDSFLHPVVKATILHFWLAYLHPYVDGNGRTARIVFYWFLLRKGYWLFKFIPISKVIKGSRVAYGKAYLYSEEVDELDLGYFVQYILRATLLSIDDFRSYVIRKKRKDQELRDQALKLSNLNERQLDIIQSLRKTDNSGIDIESHRKKYSLSYEGARRDFVAMEDDGVLEKEKKGRKYIYRISKSLNSKV